MSDSTELDLNLTQRNGPQQDEEEERKKEIAESFKMTKSISKHWLSLENLTNLESKVVNIFIESDGYKTRVMENKIGLNRYEVQVELHWNASK